MAATQCRPMRGLVRATASSKTWSTGVAGSFVDWIAAMRRACHSPLAASSSRSSRIAWQGEAAKEADRRPVCGQGAGCVLQGQDPDSAGGASMCPECGSPEVTVHEYDYGICREPATTTQVSAIAATHADPREMRRTLSSLVPKTLIRWVLPSPRRRRVARLRNFASDRHEKWSSVVRQGRHNHER